MPHTRILGFRGPAAASRAMGAVAAAIVVSVLAVAGGSIWQLRQQAEQAARLNADSATVALAAHAHQVFSSARHVLEGLATQLEAADVQDVQAFKQRFAGAGTHALLRAQADNFQALDVLSLVAADGDLVNFSRGFPAPAMNIRGREGVAEGGTDGDAQALLITAPRVAIVNGRWTFYMVRHLHTADGRPLGIVQAGIRTEYFADFYQRLQVRPRAPGGYPTRLSLLRADGVVLATAPHDPQRLAQPLQLQPGAADPLTAVRDVEGFPARVAATVHARDYLAAWRNQAWLVAGLALLSAALLSVTFALMVRVLRRREHELAADRRLRIQAEQADRAKTEFLSTITHELRTPMNGVLGTAELLLQPQPPERQRELVETLLGSGRRLLAIINDILDLTQIEAGTVVVQAVPFQPAAVAEEVRRLLAAAADAKGLRLLTRSEGALPPAVLGDAGHVREVLIRLVGNAIKFTEQGQVLLVVEARPPAPGAPGLPVLRYRVEDTGIGIAPQARERLFKPFAQGDASAQRRHEGAGLGLALAQRLAWLLGSRIDYEALPGGGTRFWFDLALPAAAVPAPTPLSPPDGVPATPGPQAAAGAPHVLVVEDNLVNAMIVQAQLASLHCTSTLAEDGEAALRCLREGGFDLVLMDCMLPAMSGYDATTLWRAIEHTEGLPHLPIVALTANTLASNVALCAQAGMDDFLTKPVALERLRALLHERLGPQRFPPADGPPAATTAPAAAAADRKPPPAAGG